MVWFILKEISTSRRWRWMLDNIVASPSLNPVDTEKGERYFSVDRGDWYRKSIFGIFSASCEGNRAANGVVDDGLTAAIEAFPIWLCDDDTREAADFIGLDPDSKKIVLVHAKVGHLRAGGAVLMLVPCKMLADRLSLA